MVNINSAYYFWLLEVLLTVFSYLRFCLLHLVTRRFAYIQSVLKETQTFERRFWEAFTNLFSYLHKR